MILPGLLAVVSVLVGGIPRQGGSGGLLAGVTVTGVLWQSSCLMRVAHGTTRKSFSWCGFKSADGTIVEKGTPDTLPLLLATP